MGCWRERHFKNKPRHCNYLKKWGNCSSFRHKFPICIIDKEGTEHFYHLGWTFRSGVLSLIQFVPALHQFNDDRPAEVHQLETSHIGTAMHEPLQRYVLKALRKKRETEERDDSKHPKLVTARGGEWTTEPFNRMCEPLLKYHTPHTSTVYPIIYSPD